MAALFAATQIGNLMKPNKYADGRTIYFPIPGNFHALGQSRPLGIPSNKGMAPAYWSLFNSQ